MRDGDQEEERKLGNAIIEWEGKERLVRIYDVVDWEIKIEDGRIAYFVLIRESSRDFFKAKHIQRITINK